MQLLYRIFSRTGGWPLPFSYAVSDSLATDNTPVIKNVRRPWPTDHDRRTRRSVLDAWVIQFIKGSSWSPETLPVSFYSALKNYFVLVCSIISRKIRWGKKKRSKTWSDLKHCVECIGNALIFIQSFLLRSAPKAPARILSIFFLPNICLTI